LNEIFGAAANNNLNPKDLLPCALDLQGFRNTPCHSHFASSYCDVYRFTIYFYGFFVLSYKPATRGLAARCV